MVATDTGAGVSLAAADGRNITDVICGCRIHQLAGHGLRSRRGWYVRRHDQRIYTAPSGTSGNVVFAQTGGLNATPAIAATGTAVGAIDISTVAGANAALSSIDAALQTVSSSRASLGAVQNRFSSTISNLQTTSENLSAARSRITDADFAQETANLSRAQVLQQAGTAMVAQANQLPQQVLTLLR